jgi:hypothetical protein
MKKITVFISSLFFCSFSYAELLYCLILSDAIIDFDGNEVESYVYVAEDAHSPESWFELDLTANTTSYFWSEEDGTKDMDTEKLTKVSDYFYYGTMVDSENQIVGYSAFILESNRRTGHLAESGYFAKFKCTSQSQKEIEMFYNMSFAPYYNN